MFPKFDKEINFQYETVTENDLRGHLRMAHIDRFDLYFKLDLSEVKVHRDMIVDTIYRLDEQELDNLIKNVNNEGNIITYLEELRGKLDEVPYDRVGIIVRVLYKNKPWLVGTKGVSYLVFSADRYAEFCIVPLIEKLATTEERYNIYYQLILDGDISVLSGICEDINRIELAYGRLAGKELKESGQLITLDELETIEKTFANRLKELAKEDRIFEAESLFFVKYFWEVFDEKECKEYFREKIKDNKYKLKFICSLAGGWHGTDGQGWSFTKANYEEYVNEDDICEVIEEYNKNEMFRDFTEIEIIKLAFFILNKGMGDVDHVTESEAKTLVKEWKKQYTT